MNDIDTILKPRPFLKWAGGKKQLLPELRKYIPKDFNKYIEPFIGAGAVFFDIASERAVIADANEELILTYEVVKDNPAELIEELKAFRNEEQLFYEVRNWDLDLVPKIRRAARLIFLNKTCFNGLYRVNRQGFFNTPFGRINNPTICDENLIYSVSDYLQNTAILHDDFENVLSDKAEQGDFIFLDPPYVPVGKFSDFKRYTKDFFSEDDQIRLKIQFDRLVELGAFPILTNSDAPFVLDLFRDYEIKIIDTKRNISSSSSSRTGKDIIVIGR